MYTSVMADTTIKIDQQVRDRLAIQAADRHMSLRAYMAELAQSRSTPAEREARAQHNRTVLRNWTGYDPTETEQEQLDAEMKERIAKALAK